MDRNEYIKNATSKILDYDERELVCLELNDHLLKNQAFSDEIGYDEERAQRKAVEAMGEADEISEYLGELHNDNYNPAFDIVFLVFWLALLSGGAYLLNQYIFGDRGCLSVLFAACSLAVGVSFLFFSYMLCRNKFVPAITAMFAAGGTGTFAWYIMREANDSFSGSVEMFKQYIFSYAMPVKSSENTQLFVVLPIAVISVFALVFCLTAIIYRIKTLKAANTLFDNHMRKGAKIISLVLALVFLALSVFFGVKFVSAQRFWQEEYRAAYLYAVEVSQNCKTFDEVKKYIKDSDYDFSYIRGNGKDITSITAAENLYSVSFILGDNQSVKLSKEERDKYLGDYSDLFDDRCDYNISVHLADASVFARQLNSVTLCTFVSSAEEIDDYYRYVSKAHTNEENNDFIKTHLPASANIYPAIEGRFSSSYSLKFVQLNGYTFNHKFDIRIQGENVKKVKAEQRKIAQIIEANPKASFEKTAELTGTRLEKPKHTLQEYKDAASMLGTAFDSYKNAIDDAYYTMYKFHSDKGYYFTLEKPPYKHVTFISQRALDYKDSISFDEKTSIFCKKSEDEKIKKVLSDSVCYSKFGVPYSWLDILLMPYFAADGTRYMYHTEVGTDEKGSYYKKHYLTNSDGMFYDADICYIDSSGNMYIDKTASLKSKDGYRYKDASGNIYTKALETSWDENGKIIYYDEYEKEDSSVFSDLF